MMNNDPLIQRRLALLDELRGSANAMLGELAQVAGIAPPGRLRDEPAGTLAEVAAFCRRTDFAAATEDARVWMRNRLGLYVARYFVVRYGGSLELQDDPARAFYLHYVLVGMQFPIAPDARLDPFAIAHDVLGTQPKPDLAALIHQAERSVLARVV